MAAQRETGREEWRPISMAVFALMVLAALSFALASIVHFGNVIALGPLSVNDSFPGAAIPEAVIAVVLGIGALSVLARWPARWKVALGATLFALFLTVYGLTVTAGSGRTGDVVYHVSVLTLLVVITVLLLLPAGRQSLSG